MPYYDALCAKAINNLIPDATFVGLEYVKHIAEMVAEVAPGKKIEMRPMTLAAYVQKNVDVNRFDAAFLDFMGKYSKSRRDDILNFITIKMRKRFVIAITMQGDQHIIDTLAQELTTGVRQLAMVYSKVYFTQTQMCHSVFVGKL
jgi:hypothetical protein